MTVLPKCIAWTIGRINRPSPLVGIANSTLGTASWNGFISGELERGFVRATPILEMSLASGSWALRVRRAKNPFQRALERVFVLDQEVEVGPVRICAASNSASTHTLTSRLLAVMPTRERDNVRHASRKRLQPPCPTSGISAWTISPSGSAYSGTPQSSQYSGSKRPV
jgi:hypothetical protein